MRRRRTGPSVTVAAATAGFLAGAITVGTVLWNLPRLLHPSSSSDESLEEDPEAMERGADRLVSQGSGTADRVDGEAVSSSITTPIVSADPVPELRGRRLELPVRGAVKDDLHDSFSTRRGSSRQHEAIDIMAPRNTPVVAVEDGTIAKLFESKAGGTTVYQFDPGQRYAYYYAHLGQYAEGLKEGVHVERGQLLGYVGTSGNAPRDAPHLHFAIFLLTESRQWWKGSPIDPFDVLK